MFTNAYKVCIIEIIQLIAKADLPQSVFEDIIDAFYAWPEPDHQAAKEFIDSIRPKDEEEWWPPNSRN
jgi:hypothetical protein